jgi:hypothetical protein
MNIAQLRSARIALLQMKVAAEQLTQPSVSAPFGTQSLTGAVLSGTGLAAGIGTGLTALGTHLGANALSRYTTFTPEALRRSGQFVDSLKATTAPQRLTNYITHGSALAGNPITQAGETGLQKMRQLYDNPLLSKLHQILAPGALDNGGWHADRAQHYQEFAAGPTRAQAQIAREVYTDPSRMHQLINQDFSGSVTPHARPNSLVESMRQRLTAKGELAPNAPFEWWNTQQYGDKYKKFFQPLFDKADASARDIKTPPQLNDSGEAMRRHVARFAKQDPQTALALRRSGMKGVAGIEALAPEAQAGLLGRFNQETQVGRTLAEDASGLLRGNVNRYAMLRNATSLPDNILHGVISRLRGARNVAGLVGVGALGVGLAGAGIYANGRTNDANVAINNNTQLQTILDAIKQSRFAGRG